MSEQPQAGDIPEWDLADRMRKSLRHARISPGEMAAYLGVGPNTVSTWINGRIIPSLQTVRLWAMHTGTDFGWLAGAQPIHRGRGFKSRASSIPAGNIIIFPRGYMVLGAGAGRRLAA